MTDYGHSLAELRDGTGFRPGVRFVEVGLGLTYEQTEVIDFYKAYNVPATWYYSELDHEGGVEVVAIGEGFVWSFSIDTYGDTDTSEATVGDFSTGIEV